MPARSVTALHGNNVNGRSRSWMRLSRRTHWPVAATFLLLACLAAPPALAINACTLADGSVTYQDKACPDGSGHVFKLRPDPAARSSRPGTGARGNTIIRNGRVIHTGPRGGQYTVSPTGRKNYLPRDKQVATNPQASPRTHDLNVPPPQPLTPAPAPEVHVGPRGGRYTIGATGRKNYLPRETAQQDVPRP